MPIDPVIHTHMAYLVQQEKKARTRAGELEDDIELWKKRVRLAEEKGKPTLADEARQRARQLIAERRELEDQLDLIDTEKRTLRKQSRMPSGEEVARSEEMLRRWKESGLIDPDEAVLEREFDEMDAEMALEELKGEPEEPGQAEGDPRQ